MITFCKISKKIIYYWYQRSYIDILFYIIRQLPTLQIKLHSFKDTIPSINRKIYTNYNYFTFIRIRYFRNRS